MKKLGGKKVFRAGVFVLIAAQRLWRMQVQCVCCSMLQCVAMCCNVLQCFAAQSVAMARKLFRAGVFVRISAPTVAHAGTMCMLQRAAMCCSVLQCCKVLQSAAVRCSMLQSVAVAKRCSVSVSLCVLLRRECGACRYNVYVAVCCNVLQCVAVLCSVLQCSAACCSMLQCVTVFSRALKSVAVCHSGKIVFRDGTYV